MLLLASLYQFSGVPKRRICLFNKHQNKLGNQTFDIKTNKWMKNELYFYQITQNQESGKHGDVQTNQLDKKRTNKLIG